MIRYELLWMVSVCSEKNTHSSFVCRISFFLPSLCRLLAKGPPRSAICFWLSGGVSGRLALLGWSIAGTAYVFVGLQTFWEDHLSGKYQQTTTQEVSFRFRNACNCRRLPVVFFSWDSSCLGFFCGATWISRPCAGEFLELGCPQVKCPGHV